ncbi:unnamed protein product [Knipowitschia caucasica]|uniref:Transcription factor E2F7 n=1 Tax=Knipowitschia caucasica TaxID=637954 RepID=A0AAV2J112_KNICA
MEVECLALKDLTSHRTSFGSKKEGQESDHKENVRVDRRRSTPLKSPEAGSSVLSRRGPDLNHITPIKHSGTPAEPWTPTANLKMLISAASPDIRDRELKKVLFRSRENQEEEEEEPRSPELFPEDDADDAQLGVSAGDDVDKKPSRKQKSLGLLCQKFLALFPDYPPPNSPIWISLDKVASNLGVERRRIYDIVNVLESLMIVGRMAKNSYLWYGRRRLEAMLSELQSQGREQGYDLHMEGVKGGVRGGREEEPEDTPNGGGNRKDKSLRIMSQKFVMLFLVSKTQTVTLDTSAKILIEDGPDSSSHSKYKTKVRRLYDIANVLTSLGLIKKVHVREERGRKPAFQWLGPTEFNTTVAPGGLEATQDTTRVKMSRHSSFNIRSASVTVQRQVSSAPSSPRREHAALQNQPLDYSRKSPVCRLQFGTSSDGLPPVPVSPQTTAQQPSLQMHSLHPGHMFSPSAPAPASSCLAYLQSLSQPSVVMLYRAPQPAAQGKRKRDQDEDNSAKKGANGAINGFEVTEDNTEMEGYEESPSPVHDSLPSHYLYVPNTAGLNSVNLLLSSAHSTSVPGVAVPYVLLPSSSLPPLPLLSTSPLRNPSGPPHMSLSQIVLQTPSTPEQTTLYAASTPHSVRAKQPMTPQTPKENAAAKSFFQTPATPGNRLSAAPNGRKRGSAQRRLDVEQPTNI